MPDLKPCPIMVGAENMKSAYCIGKDCSWWCEFAQDCAVPLIAGILADSSICMTGWNCRVGEEDKHENLD